MSYKDNVFRVIFFQHFSSGTTWSDEEEGPPEVTGMGNAQFPIEKTKLVNTSSKVKC